jgi:diacylglycerol kinase
VLITTQRNFQIHLAAAGVAIGFGLWLGLSASEWLVLVVVIGLVLFAEGVNTAIERAVDLAQPEIDPAARNAKDIGAAAVLIAAATAVVVGLILFGPKLLRLMGIGALE